MSSDVLKYRIKAVGLAALAFGFMATEVLSRSPETDAQSGIDAFAENCFSRA